jgi:transcriptional regulator with XRE-family HTH domain
MATNTPFGPWESLRIIRERSALTQRQLSRDAGVAASYLCDLENGNRWPTPAVTTKLAAALHAPYTAIARIRPNEEGVA